MNVENNVLDKLSFHHIGLLVNRMEDSLKYYSELFGKEKISPIFKIESQKVEVCFVQIGLGNYLELVMPIDESSVTYNLLKKRVSYYHIAYMVDDIVATVRELEHLNYKALDFFNSEAFENKRCIFLYSPEAHLFELIER
jgi:methylmalonyl-CoA/ethylmalonyl-CoA epimerase